jgi:hypothetical protein
MLISNKQYVLVEFLVGKNKRIKLPCIALVDNHSIQKGLMFVKRMSKNVGAFFVFEKSDYHKMWMKNTALALDILFINELGIVTEIVEGKPFDETSIGGNISSLYAIEVIKGFVKRNNILKGTRIKVSRIKKQIREALEEKLIDNNPNQERLQKTGEQVIKQISALLKIQPPRLKLALNQKDATAKKMHDLIGLAAFFDEKSWSILVDISEYPEDFVDTLKHECVHGWQTKYKVGWINSESDHNAMFWAIAKAIGVKEQPFFDGSLHADIYKRFMKHATNKNNIQGVLSYKWEDEYGTEYLFSLMPKLRTVFAGATVHKKRKIK